jgi:thiamine biosynthesis lipoprotein
VAGDTALARYEYAEPHLGTTVRVVFYAGSPEQAARAARAAFARVAALDATLSDYRDDSELMRLCARAGGPPVPVSGDLFRALAAAQDWAARSHGAFDATAGPVIRLWRRARRILERPPAGALAEARARVGHEKLVLDERARTARLAVPGMSLDLGGIGKGFAADEAQAVLRAHGITRALVAAGGDVVLSGPPPDRPAWTVEIALPEPLRAGATPLELHDAAVSTSGDARQWVTLDGVRYSHIVDPRTGLALTGPSAATVIAPTGTASDALATAVSVLDVAEALALIERTPGAAARITRRGREALSKGWSTLAGGGARSVTATAEGGSGGARGPSLPAASPARAIPPR